jgi:hypothetical protein
MRWGLKVVIVGSRGEHSSDCHQSETSEDSGPAQCFLRESRLTLSARRSPELATLLRQAGRQKWIRGCAKALPLHAADRLLQDVEMEARVGRILHPLSAQYNDERVHNVAVRFDAEGWPSGRWRRS